MYQKCSPAADCPKTLSKVVTVPAFEIGTYDTLCIAKQSNVPHYSQLLCVCFVALRPKSTAMVIAGRSVHLTTPFPGQA